MASLCTFIGAAGYYMYGPSAADVVIFNLKGNLAMACMCLVLINPVAKFALTMEPVGAAAARAADAPKGSFKRLVVRTALAISILVAARSLPFLAYVMALVGSFMTISVSVTFPAICHLVRNKSLFSVGSECAWTLTSFSSADFAQGEAVCQQDCVELLCCLPRPHLHRLRDFGIACQPRGQGVWGGMIALQIR